MKQQINRQNAMIIIFAVLLLLPPAVHARVFPDSFIAFRDTVYMQNENLPQTMRLYAEAKQDIEMLFTGADLYLALARCAYLMGLSFRADDRNAEASACFEQGIAWAEESIELCPSSDGYRILGTNIAFLCEVKRSFGLKNFGKIEENAKKALEMDPDNLAARYVIAAQYVVAPWPLANLRKGAELLGEITVQNYLSMDKEDLFNLYLMLEVACLKQKKNEEAQIWHERAAALYSTNNFVTMLMKP